MSHQVADPSLLPVEIWVAISWQTDLPGLAALARTCRVLRPTAEEVLYRKEIELSNSLEGERLDCTALLWAASTNNLGTLNKLITNGHNLSRDYLDMNLYQRDDISLSWNEWAAKTGSLSLLNIRSMAALHVAAAAGFDDVVEQLLDAGADIEARAINAGSSKHKILRVVSGSATPLGLALGCARVSTALILLKRGASQIVVSDRQGRIVFTALGLATCLNLTPVVDELITHLNADLRGDLYDPDLLPIHYAVMCEPPAIESLQLLASVGSMVGSRLSGRRPGLEEGSTILHLLAYVADETTMIKALEILVAGGADIHGVTDLGRNLLHHAAYNGRPVMTRYLLEQGLNANAAVGSPDNNLIASLARGLGDWASFWPENRLEKSFECAELLVKARVPVRREAVETIIRAAAYRTASFLLPNIVDPPEEDGYWIQALYRLVTRYDVSTSFRNIYIFLHDEATKRETARNYELLEFLARHFPPPTKSDVPVGWKVIILSLLQFGDIDKLEGYLNTPMVGALKINGRDVLSNVLIFRKCTREPHASILHRLAANVLDPSATDLEGNTYIHHLVGNKTIGIASFKPILELLVKQGVDVNRRNKSSWVALETLLHAGQSYNPDVDVIGDTLQKIRLLLAHGADSTVVDQSGRTATEVVGILQGLCKEGGRSTQDGAEGGVDEK